MPPVNVEFLVMDVDGVLTDGRIIYTDSGELIKVFDVTDGTGIKYWHRLGRASAIISGRSSPAVDKRATELGIVHVFQDVKDKVPVLQGLLDRLNVKPERVAYVGDDLMDLAAMRMVGFPVAVAGARPEVLSAAEYVTRNPGGRGAVREVVEVILKAQGLWEQVLSRYTRSLP